MCVLCVLQQYWVGSGPWKFVPVASFAEAFSHHKTGQKGAADLAVPFVKSQQGTDALINKRFSLSSEFCTAFLFRNLHIETYAIWHCQSVCRYKIA